MDNNEEWEKHDIDLCWFCNEKPSDGQFYFISGKTEPVWLMCLPCFYKSREVCRKKKDVNG